MYSTCKCGHFSLICRWKIIGCWLPNGNDYQKSYRKSIYILIISKYYRLEGKVEIITSGKYFDICVKESWDYEVKHAIVISVDTVFDLDKGQKIIYHYGTADISPVRISIVHERGMCARTYIPFFVASEKYWSNKKFHRL